MFHTHSPGSRSAPWVSVAIHLPNAVGVLHSLPNEPRQTRHPTSVPTVGRELVEDTLFFKSSGFAFTAVNCRSGWKPFTGRTSPDLKHPCSTDQRSTGTLHASVFPRLFWDAFIPKRGSCGPLDRYWQLLEVPWARIDGQGRPLRAPPQNRLHRFANGLDLQPLETCHW